MLRVLRHCLAVGVALFLGAACLSPTLPLPPPDRPDVSAPDGNGLVRLQGIAVPRAEVIALNHNNNVIAGQVTGEDARYDFTIKAEANDFIELFYMQGSDESLSVRITVPEE